MLEGGDPGAIGVYKWHIDARNAERYKEGVPTDRWKMTTDHYIFSSASLLRSLETNGFSMKEPIFLSKDNEIMSGAHRLGASLALGINCFTIKTENEVTAPPWDRQWFLDNEIRSIDLKRLDSDWGKLNAGEESGGRSIPLGETREGL